MALRTPHLIAPINLENHTGTLRTGPRVAREQSGRLDAVRVACMVFGQQDLVAFLARLLLTYTTLPVRAEESLAFGRWTCPNKEPLHSGRITLAVTVQIQEPNRLFEIF